MAQQQGTSPTPQTSAAPQSSAPQTAAEIREQVREQMQQVREQVRQATDQAREEAQQATATAQQGGGNGGPVIVVPPRFPNFPTDVPNNAYNLSIALLVTLAFVIVGLPIARAIGRWIDRRSLAPAPAAPNVEVTAQLQRIVHQVEATAIEVERISEGQRYLTQLEAARRAPDAMQLADRVR